MPSRQRRLRLELIEKRSPGWLRILEILAGVLVLAVAFFVFADSSFALTMLAYTLGFGLFILGIVEIVAAGFAKHPPVWVRGLIGVVGVLTVILSVFVILDSSLGELSLALIMAIVLVAVGVRDIAHGVSGHRPVKIDPAVVTKV